MLKNGKLKNFIVPISYDLLFEEKSVQQVIPSLSLSITNATELQHRFAPQMLGLFFGYRGNKMVIFANFQ